MKIDIKSLALRPMSNKWASCSTDSNLNFKNELLDIDKYLIVHELLHFNVPNYEKIRESLMVAYLRNCEVLEK
jgi:predicted metal-dependent hydrolase